MKYFLKKSLIRLSGAALAAALISGCTSSQEDKTPPLQAEELSGELEKLENNPSSNSVKEIFSRLIALSSDAYEHSYEIASEVEIGGGSDSPDGNVSPSGQENGQTSLSTYLYEEGVLYEVLRYSETVSSDAWIGLVKIDQEKTVQLNCLPASPDLSVFSPDPQLILDFSQEDRNRQTEKEDRDAAENAILSEESRSLAVLFGSQAPAPYQNPEFYDFSVSSQDGLQSLTMELNENGKNAQDSSSGPEEKLTEALYRIDFEESGGIVSAASSYTVQSSDGEQKVTRSRQRIQKAGSAQARGVLQDLFDQVEDRSLPVKSEFVLDLDSQNPWELLKTVPEAKAY